MKILLADTDCETIDDSNMVFHMYQPDWQVSIIDSGKECLNIIDNSNGNSPDAVISSIELADMSDFDLIEQIRASSDTSVTFLSDDKDTTT